MQNSSKPYKGIMDQWETRKCSEGLGFYVVGIFRGHPVFDGKVGYTSYVVRRFSHLGKDYVETRNSIYQLGNRFHVPPSKELSVMSKT